MIDKRLVAFAFANVLLIIESQALPPTFDFAKLFPSFLRPGSTFSDFDLPLTPSVDETTCLLTIEMGKGVPDDTQFSATVHDASISIHYNYSWPISGSDGGDCPPDDDDLAITPDLLSGSIWDIPLFSGLSSLFPSFTSDPLDNDRPFLMIISHSDDALPQKEAKIEDKVEGARPPQAGRRLQEAGTPPSLPDKAIAISTTTAAVAKELPEKTTPQQSNKKCGQHRGHSISQAGGGGVVSALIPKKCRVPMKGLEVEFEKEKHIVTVQLQPTPDQPIEVLA